MSWGVPFYSFQGGTRAHARKDTNTEYIISYYYEQSVNIAIFLPFPPDFSVTTRRAQKLSPFCGKKLDKRAEI
jgi:hypothetical protein